jgi:hypothetical protein
VLLLTDTVGFIRKLPHHLVASFRSTLAEVVEADLWLHVVDASDPDFRRQLANVEEVLATFGGGAEAADAADVIASTRSTPTPRGAALRAADRVPRLVQVSALTARACASCASACGRNAGRSGPRRPRRPRRGARQRRNTARTVPPLRRCRDLDEVDAGRLQEPVLVAPVPGRDVRPGPGPPATAVRTSRPATLKIRTAVGHFAWPERHRRQGEADVVVPLNGLGAGEPTKREARGRHVEGRSRADREDARCSRRARRSAIVRGHPHLRRRGRGVRDDPQVRPVFWRPVTTASSSCRCWSSSRDRRGDPTLSRRSSDGVLRADDERLAAVRRVSVVVGRTRSRFGTTFVRSSLPQPKNRVRHRARPRGHGRRRAHWRVRIARTCVGFSVGFCCSIIAIRPRHVGRRHRRALQDGVLAVVDA